ncbi:hypothetical protein [Mucilaginibacter ginkgonis]|uniref:Lipoprotein n=1 Tax=Mucilaginibacter ginkgonis TaxID=2682091 RepID=A0A6I4HZ62_9SPHI|nr:hypothetical protein [Mucilaginibacter ginkgonis]QQL49374.1 hypothetical protein GO620_014545 [Mucilaginibacter ginkgonis]
MKKHKPIPSIIAATTVFFACIWVSCSQPKTTATDKPKQDTAMVTKADTSHLVGMWLDEDIKTDNGDQVAYQIVTKGPKTYIQVITFKEKKLSVNDNPEIGPSAMEVRKEKNKYISIENSKDVYLIENSGDLLIYDVTGFIAKCKRML